MTTAEQAREQLNGYKEALGTDLIDEDVVGYILTALDAQIELDAWHEVFETTQLTHAQAHRDQARVISEEHEQQQVQLAGCSVAAFGGTKDPAKQGDYGWSGAYQDVLDLRLKCDRYKAALERIGPALQQAAGIAHEALAGS